MYQYTGKMVISKEEMKYLSFYQAHLCCKIDAMRRFMNNLQLHVNDATIHNGNESNESFE